MTAPAAAQPPPPHAPLPIPADLSPLHPAHASLLLGPVRTGRNRIEWAHLDCAVWAPRVFIDAQGMHGLWKELRRARPAKCSLCGVGGAVPMCRSTFHWRCARQLGSGCGVDWDRYEILCGTHWEEARAHLSGQNDETEGGSLSAEARFMRLMEKQDCVSRDS
jgi:hypothetical protein